MEPLITNPRAAREWAWIVQQVGEQAALEALGKLPGNRRPYPLNVARVLGLRLPPDLAQEPLDREKARQRIAALRRALAR